MSDETSKLELYGDELARYQAIYAKRFERKQAEKYAHKGKPYLSGIRVINAEDLLLDPNYGRVVEGFQ